MCRFPAQLSCGDFADGIESGRRAADRRQPLIALFLD
jgi:hypothetical protein